MFPFLKKIGADSIAITEDDKSHLEKIYFNKLKQEFGVIILYFKIDVLAVHSDCLE